MAGMTNPSEPDPSHANSSKANPYVAPQALPPPDPQRWRRWVGWSLLLLSGLIALAAVAMTVAFFKVRYFPRPGQELGDHGRAALGNFLVATLLFLAGRWLIKRGQPPRE